MVICSIHSQNHNQIVHTSSPRSNGSSFAACSNCSICSRRSLATRRPPAARRRDAAKLAEADGGPPCSVWGPTCDGIDCVLAADSRLPAELPIGSWLYFPDMGAYTRCAGSNFNGMALPDVVYLQSRAGGDGRPQPPSVAAAHMLQQLRQDGVGKSM